MGINDRQQYFLVEAKANIPEIFSSCAAKNPDSINRIKTALHHTQKYLHATNGTNWFEGFYQYANRLSHLYFLREICDVDAYLIFLYFCNDNTYKPTRQEEWKGAIQVKKHIMSLNQHTLKKYVLELFVDINSIDNVVCD